MRITVVHSDGVPDGCILSVKAGEQRRQMPLASGGQSLSFENAGINPGVGPLKIDLLERLATCTPESISAGEHSFEVKTGQGHQIRLVLRLEDIAPEHQGAVPGLSPNAGTTQFESTGTTIFANPGREAKIAEEAQKYLEEHKLLQAMRSGLSRVLRERPAVPHQMLSEEILRIQSGAVPFGCAAAATMVPTGAGGYAASPEVPMRRKSDPACECIATTPDVPRDLPLRIIDLGSGETGFYSYGSEADMSRAVQVGDKMKGGFMMDWVNTGRVNEFTDEVLRRYEVSREDAGGGELVFLAGATGSNREDLDQKEEARTSTKAFVKAVEARMTEQAGRCCQLRIFVPQGSLEAQYELSAVRWLIRKIAGTSEMSTDTAAQFVGTISAGGGSSQLALSGADGIRFHSVPLGNKKPTTDKLFSSPPTQAEVAAWAAQFREALKEEGFPSGVNGLFVGISATFYASKEAKCADKVVSKADAIQALTRRLDDILQPKPEDNAGAIAKSAANVALVRELVDFVLGDEAKILFRRNWKVNGQSVAATWTLGMYSDAESMGSFK